jgi:glycosyltransferase involved in cell wall biosynthesis
MRILVIRNSKQKNSYTTCIHTLLEEIGRRHDYQIIVTDSFKDISGAGNAIAFITLPQASFINKFLQQQRLNSFIIENKFDLLFQNADSIFKQKRIPQLLIADDIDQLPVIKKISFSKIFLLTYSQFAKQLIIDRGVTNIIHLIPFFADSVFQPINWSMKQQVKIDYTEGSEYFINPQSFDNMDDILNLLKAFSGFKRWQQSGMKLILTGKLFVPPSDWEEKLGSYKYREDVLIYNNLQEQEKAKLLAGAYACIHLLKKDNDVLPLLQSLQCHIPVITTEAASAKEYVASAGLVTTNTLSEITQQMILMYKDEDLRSKLAENCALQANELSKERSLQALEAIIF